MRAKVARSAVALTGETVRVLFTVRVLLVVGILLFSHPGVLLAAGPIGMSSNNNPYRWTTRVEYYVDAITENLGTISNAEATEMVTSSFDLWMFDDSLNLDIKCMGHLATHPTTQTFGSVYGTADGKTEILFDSDGSLTDSLMGSGAKSVVCGFAGPDIVDSSTGVITEGIGVLNGFLLGRATVPSEFVKTVMTHEFGHLLGLGHAQLNSELVGDGNPDDDQYVPIMFPYARSTDNPSLAASLHLDDKASIAYLYSGGSYPIGTGAITGRVTNDGSVFRGANVIARNIASPLAVAVSWPSGIADRTSGAWEARWLPSPGTYTVEIEPIDSRFTGGSSIGDFDPPPSGFVEEFYNGADESSDPFVDYASAASNVILVDATPVTGIDLGVQSDLVTLVSGDSKEGTIFPVDGALPQAQYKVSSSFRTRAITFRFTPETGKEFDFCVNVGSRVTAGVTPTFKQEGLTDALTYSIDFSSTPPISPSDYYVALVNKSSTQAGFSLSLSMTDVQLADPALARLPTDMSGGQGCRAGLVRPPGAERSMGVGLLTIMGLFFVMLLGRKRRSSAHAERESSSEL